MENVVFAHNFSGYECNNSIVGKERYRVNLKVSGFPNLDNKAKKSIALFLQKQTQKILIS